MSEFKSAYHKRLWREWLFLLGFLTIFGGYIAQTQYTEYRQTEADERLRLTQQTEVIEKNLLPQLAAANKAMESARDAFAALLNEEGALSPKAVSDLNQRLKTFSNTLPGVRTLLVVDAHTRIIASNNPTVIGADLAHREWLQLAAKRNAPQTLYVVAPIKSLINTYTCALVRSVSGSKGEFLGVIYASIHPEFARIQLESALYTPDARATLVHGDGKLFLMVPEREDVTGKDLAVPGSLFTRHLASGQRVSVMTDTVYMTNEKRMVAFRTIQPTNLAMDKPLVVTVSRDVEAVFAPWRADLHMHIMIFVVLALVGMLSLFLYQRRNRVLETLALQQHQALQASEARQHAIFDASPDALLISDAHGIIVQANLQAERLLGFAAHELIGQSIENLVPERSRSTHPKLRDDFIASKEARRNGHVAVMARRKDGTECDVEVGLSRIEIDAGVLFLSALRDISGKKKAAAELLIAATAFEAQEGMVVTDAQCVILRCNRAFCEITGYSAEEAIGRRMNFLKSDRHDANFWAQIWQGIHASGAWRGEIWNRHKNGEIHPHWLTISAVKAEDGVVSNYVGTYTDISEQKKTEEKLLQQNNMLASIIENFPGGVSVMDAELRHVTHNDLFAQLMDFPPELFAKPNLSFKDFIQYNAERGEYGPGDPAQQVADAIARARLFEAHKIERTRPNGRVLDIRGVPLPDGGFVTLYIDITEHKQAQADLRIAATAFESQEAMVVTDPNGFILRVNRAFADITGYTSEELVGRTPAVLKSDRHSVAFYRDMWASLRMSGSWQGEIWDRRKSGEIYPKWLTISAVRDAGGAVTHYIGTHHDMSERKKAQERIEELAFFDQLTGLPNRTLLLDRLRQAMVASERSANYGALLIIDLDNFKALNDTQGHDVGDVLLKQVAQRLTLCVRDGDTVARLGGDEFVVILSSLSTDELEAGTNSKAVSKKILAALGEPYQFGAQVHRSTASVGVTLFRGSDASADELMKQADLAMYRTKEGGRNALCFFDPEMETVVRTRVALEKDLYDALQASQFLLHYQAQVGHKGQVTGAEVLVRWMHPQRGMVSPADFIPLAEETGLILPLGHWVLETACKQLAQWATQPHMQHLTVAVNVSAHQFRQSNFVEQVLSVLERTGANPQRLKLELTESMLAANVEEMIEKMIALKATGIGFSLDDFGTGYSSLSYLKRLPLDQLKIDQSFVRDVMIDPNDAAIARTIVALAKSLGLGVIAEGVESAVQRDFLEHSGCHAYQGYFFSRPLPLDRFEAFALQ